MGKLWAWSGLDSRLGEVLRKQEVWIFLCLIVVVNSVFIGAIAADLLSFHFYNLGRFLLLGLTLAGVVFAIRGFGGLRALVSSLGVWRVNPLWYLLALVWAPTVAVLFLTAKCLLTGTNVFEAMTFGVILRPSMIRTVIIASFIGEIVWVAYSIGALSKRFGPVIGSAIVGVFWTAWWVPMVLFGKGVIPNLPISSLLVSMLGIATMCGFVYLKSRSGLVVLLLQIMANASFNVFPVVPTNGGHITYLAFSATYFLGALGLFVLFGPRPLFGRAQPAADVETADRAIAA